MLPKSNSLRVLNKWLCGSGYQIDQPARNFVCYNETGDILFRRKTLAALKSELNACLESDAKSSELDQLPCELFRLMGIHGLRPIVLALAKAARRAVDNDVEIPTGETEGTLAYPSDLYNAADNLERTAGELSFLQRKN